MDGRLAFLIGVGLGGLLLGLFTDNDYTYSWLILGLLAFGWAAVVVFRNRRRGPNKHARKT